MSEKIKVGLTADELMKALNELTRLLKQIAYTHANHQTKHTAPSMDIRAQSARKKEANKRCLL